MLARIRNLIIKEFIHYSRDRLLTVFLLLVPMLQLVLLAQATGRGINHLTTAVLDLDHSSYSRRLIAALDNTEDLDVLYYPANPEELQQLLDLGQADVGVVIPRGFAQVLIGGSSSRQIQVLVDASNSAVGVTALRAAGRVIGDFIHEQMARRAAKTGLRELSSGSLIELRTSIHFNPTLNIRHYMIPAQVGFIIYQVTLSVASLGLARERELGTLEQLMVTPLRRWELILGKAIPALVVGTVNFFFVISIARLVFEVPMRGSFALLLALTLPFLAVETSWGVLISTVSRTQQQAILFVFVQAMVDVAFSGYLVPVKNMPALLRTIAQFSPMQHYLVIIRSVMLKGTGIEVLWPRAAILLALSLGVAVIAWLNVSKRLD